MKLILVVDGGTTNLRVTAVDASDHRVLAKEGAEGGVKYTAVSGNNLHLKQELKECIRKVLQDTGSTYNDVQRCIAFGMITSNMGLYEIPHLVAPVNIQDLHAGMQAVIFPEVAPFLIELIPGVRNSSLPVDETNCGKMDMMRGEEVEAIGLWKHITPTRETIFVLPGSHNKMVRISVDGRILGCMTSISGELLDAMVHHTILSDSVQHGFCSAETYDSEMAVRGAKASMEAGLGRAAFSGRILNVLGKMPVEKIQSWLLGAVLAEDVKATETFSAGESDAQFVVAGKPPLQQAFCDVLSALTGKNTISVLAEESAKMGLCGALTIAEE